MIPKKVLAVFFSQTGQMEDIIHHLTVSFQEPDITVEKVRIRPRQPFPFPWTTRSFFEAMPHSVDGVPEELADFEFKEPRYDLIILGYQPWFLSPSIPINSLLMHPRFKAIAANTPVVTISGCRNMWINAQEKIKIRLKEADATLAGNIALVDRHDNYTSLVTIFHWMLNGKKDKKWGIFPKPGVADEDVAGTTRFGETIKQHLLHNQLDTLQQKLVAQNAVVVKYPLMFIERKAGRIFKIWAGIIRKKKNKQPWLTAFKYYILIALFIAAPIILTIDALLFRPFLGKRIKKQKEYYEGVDLA